MYRRRLHVKNLINSENQHHKPPDCRSRSYVVTKAISRKQYKICFHTDSQRDKATLCWWCMQRCNVCVVLMRRVTQTCLNLTLLLLLLLLLVAVHRALNLTTWHHHTPWWRQRQHADLRRHYMLPSKVTTFYLLTPLSWRCRWYRRLTCNQSINQSITSSHSSDDLFYFSTSGSTLYV